MRVAKLGPFSPCTSPPRTLRQLHSQTTMQGGQLKVASLLCGIICWLFAGEGRCFRSRSDWPLLVPSASGGSSFMDPSKASAGFAQALLMSCRMVARVLARSTGPRSACGQSQRGVFCNK
jgi:hypothetical protein